MQAQRQAETDEQVETAMAAWQTAQAKGGLAAQITDAYVIRTHPNWTVFGAMAGDQAVVVKHFTQDGAADAVHAASVELQLVGPHMCEGPLQINQVLADDPEQGILILSQVPDAPLQSVLDDPAADRSALMRQAGDWLTRYVGARISTGKFAPFYWQEQLVNTSFKALDPETRRLAQAMRSKLRAHAEKLRAFQVRRVAGHGDFATHNFGYEQGVLYGFDVQGETIRPLAQELAHFLVLTTMKSQPDAGPQYIGLREADVAALCIQAGLPELEYETVFRYLVGWYMCRFFARYAHNPARVAALRGMLTRALDDWPD